MEDAPLPNKHAITLKSNKGNKYNINFTNIENYLSITSINESNKNVIYEDKIHLDDIKSNKYFSICQTIYDVLLTINSILSSGELKLEEIDEELILTIPLNHPLAKEIVFNLKLVQNNKPNNESKELINELLIMVTSLSQKIENQQKEIDQLKSRVTDLEKINQTKISSENVQKNKKDDFIDKKDNNDYFYYDNYYQYNHKNKKNKIYNNKHNNYNNIKFNNNNNLKGSLQKITNLIKNGAEELSIQNWINYLSRPIHFKLLFRMTRDGTRTVDFHMKCDNKGKTLILIETNEGIRMGGYTSLQWNVDGIKKYGPNLWAISFQNNMCRYITMNQSRLGAIICNMNNGPSFDEYIVINNNDLTKGYIENNTFLKQLGLSQKMFGIKELEVFQVNIN